MRTIIADIRIRLEVDDDNEASLDTYGEIMDYVRDSRREIAGLVAMDEFELSDVELTEVTA